MNRKEAAEIMQVLRGASEVAEMFLPQYRAYFVLGRVVAEAVPELYENVLKLTAYAEPTRAEKDELARKLRVLAGEGEPISTQRHESSKTQRKEGNGRER